METEKFTPYIRAAHDSEVDEKFLLNRTIFDYELIYLKSGELLYVEEDVQYSCKPGFIIFIRPGKNHILKAISNSIQQPHIHFDFFYKEDSPNVKVSFKKQEQMSDDELKQIREDITNKLDIKIPSVIKLRNPYIIETLFYDVINEFNEQMPYRDLLLQGSFLRLWGVLCREFYWSKNSCVQRYWEDMEFIKDYLYEKIDREVSLEELSDKVKISKCHILRLFKLSYGMTPIKYQSYLRLGKAKELIQYTSMSINEISEQLGFNSIHSFSRWFKSYEGIAPSYYREKGQQLNFDNLC